MPWKRLLAGLGIFLALLAVGVGLGRLFTILPGTEARLVAVLVFAAVLALHALFGPVPWGVCQLLRYWSPDGPDPRAAEPPPLAPPDARVDRIWDEVAILSRLIRYQSTVLEKLNKAVKMISYPQAAPAVPPPPRDDGGSGSRSGPPDHTIASDVVPLAPEPFTPMPLLGLKADQLFGLFNRLRTQTFPVFLRALVERLKGLGGAAVREPVSPQDLEAGLAEGVLAAAAYRLAALAAAYGRDRVQELGLADPAVARVRQDVALTLARRLAAISPDLLSGELQPMADDLVREGVEFAFHLLTAQFPGLLIYPVAGAQFDTTYHEAVGDSTSAPTDVVRATVFPGYQMLSDDATVVRARVVARHPGQG